MSTSVENTTGNAANTASVEALRPPNVDPQILLQALTSLAEMFTFTSRDNSLDRCDAWAYGIVVGWDCEEVHEHDDICGGTSAMDTLAHLHGWPEERCQQLRSYRTAFKQLNEQLPTKTLPQ